MRVLKIEKICLSISVMSAGHALLSQVGWTGARQLRVNTVQEQQAEHGHAGRTTSWHTLGLTA